jgi:uncharacterized protein (TIGR02186 family)
MRRAVLAVILALISPAMSRAESLIVTLSAHRIAITSTFAGADLALFGSIERDARTIARASAYDIVVSVRGPLGTVTVREKDRVGIIWVNREARRYPRFPSFVSTLSSRPMSEFATVELLRRVDVGLTAFFAPPASGQTPDVRDASFRDALWRLKLKEGLFRHNDRGISFLSPTLFQAQIRVPPSSPTGTYTVDVTLFADGAVLARQRTNFEVVKVGFEAFIAESARERSWTYGFAAAALAITFGWLASIAFRRD